MSDAEKISFSCGHCRKSIRIGAKHAGRKGKCPRCREVIRVPRSLEEDADRGTSVLSDHLGLFWRGLSLWEKGLWCLMPFALALGALPFVLLALSGHPTLLFFLDALLVPVLVASALAAPHLRKPQSRNKGVEVMRSLLVALPAAGILNHLFWQTFPVATGLGLLMTGDHLHGAVVRVAATTPFPPALSIFASSFLLCFLLLFAWRLRRPLEQSQVESRVAHGSKTTLAGQVA
jgi:phage FluMu protein Com